jgi:hypothetical protein
MTSNPLNGANEDGGGRWENREHVFRRTRRLDDGDNRGAVLVVQPATGHPSSSRLDRVTRDAVSAIILKLLARPASKRTVSIRGTFAPSDRRWE